MQLATWRDVALAVSGVVSALVVGALGVAGDPLVYVVAGYLCSALALVGGLALALTPPTRNQSTRQRVLLGLGLALSSISVMLGATGGPMGTRYHPWDTLNIVLIFALVTGSLVRRWTLNWLFSVRVALEGVVLAAGLTTLIWSFWFVGDELPAGDAHTVAGVLVVGVFLLSTAVLNPARGTDPWLCLASLSASGLVLCYLISVRNEILRGDPGWIGYCLSCVCWSAVLIAAFRAGRRPSVDIVSDQARVEWRVLVLVGVALPLEVAGLGVMILREGLDGIGVLLVGVFLLALLGRELVRAWHSHWVLSRLARQARLDGLTQLPNLRALDEHLNLLSSRHVGSLAVVTIDLDRFKDVNDLLGRAAGDELLQALAEGLGTLACDVDAQLYRTAGDEFVLVSQRPGSGRQLAEAALDLVGRVPESLGALRRMPVRASVGLSEGRVNPDADGARHPRDHVTQSAQAMRLAKTQRNGLAVFDASMATRQQRNRLIEERLRTALETGAAIEVHFQPVVRLARRAIVGAEALARWNAGPGLGSVGPAHFVAIAEEHGLMEPLGEQVLEAALRGAVNSGLIARGLWVGVNVSPLQLRSATFVDRVAEALARNAVPPKQLVIEITESVFVHTDDPAVDALRDLHALGVGVSLDDFGTGYSSLAYLTRLPVTGLKIDRSITIGLDNPKTAAIAASIAELANRLDLEVIVEGIETVRQERQLRAMGFDYVQGMLYSSALPVTDLMARMRHYDNAGTPRSSGLGWQRVPHPVDGLVRPLDATLPPGGPGSGDD